MLWDVYREGKFITTVLAENEAFAQQEAVMRCGNHVFEVRKENKMSYLHKNKLDDIKRPICFVLIGLPGSGKSTWREKLLASTEKQFTIVSSDDEIEKIMVEKGISYNEAWKDYIGRATAAMKANAARAINSRENIIWDQTNMNQKKRRGILSQLPKDYYKIAVDFSVDPTELSRRLKERYEKTGKFIPESVILDKGKSYQAPTKTEGFDEIVKVST